MVKFGFYLLSAVMILSPFITLFKGGDKNYSKVYLIFIPVWVIYIVGITLSEVLDDFSFPPRIPLMIIIPVVALILFYTSRKGFRELIESVPEYSLVTIQSFRIIVELLIYGAFLEGVFPKRVTFEGINFDILVGFSAAVVGFLSFRGKIGTKGLLIWNIISLMILSVTVYSFISSFYFSDFVTTTDIGLFVRVPYIFLAAILLPMAIFYHVVSIRKCTMILNKA